MPAERRPALDAHLAGCADCRRHHDELSAALASLKANDLRIQTPDAKAEWLLLSARLNQSAQPRPRTWRTPDHKWAAIWSTGALAACLALAFLLNRGGHPGDETTLAQVPAPARADYVELGDATATPVVYLDQDTGWLIVWAEGA
jgi:anti-sigma factor RsiW